jgi:hypothetical protein
VRSNQSPSRASPSSKARTAWTPGPVPGAFDKVLFGAVRELITQSRDLGLLLVANHDGMVAPAEDLLLPAGQASDLPRQLGEKVAHELARFGWHLAGVTWTRLAFKAY